MPQPSPYAKPGPYVTQLSSGDEQGFQSWVKANKIPFDPSPTSDYDMRGYYKDNIAGSGGVGTKVSQFDGRPHFPDTYKTPYHHTFSNESRYATPDAPHWNGDRLTDKNGGIVADETPKKAGAGADPWVEAAKGYKPEQGAPAAANDDWKVWQAQDTNAPEQEGFLHSLGSSLGITAPAEAPTLKHAFKDAAETAITGPIAPLAKSLYEGAKRSAGELGKAFTSATEGNGYGAAQHAITALPIVGPALDKGADQYADKNYAGEAGTLLGAAAQAAPIALGGVDAAMPERPLVGEIPTRAKAGKLFQSLKTDLADHPVNLTRTQPRLAELIQLSKEGGGNVPTPIRQLANVSGQGTPKSVPILRAMQNDLNGVTEQAAQPKPLTYPVARNFQSGISSMSRDDLGQMAGPMKGQVKQLSKAFYDDIRESANGAGRGEDYAKAMRMNRQAEQIRAGLKTAAKVGIPSVVGGGLLAKVLTSGLK